MEIIQPKPLEASQIKDWAGLPAHHEQWLRQIAGQLNLDASKLALGFVLDCICNDDVNAILFPEREPLGAQKNLLTRLYWEVSVKEMPETIKTEMRQVIKRAEAADWGNPDQRNPAIVSWQKFKDRIFAKTLHSRTNNLSLAYIYYYSNNSSILQEKWNEYTQTNP